MSNVSRPVLLGYIRAEALASGVELPKLHDELDEFAASEEFHLGRVYVGDEGAPGAFHALMAELAEDESAFGVVVPSRHHLTSAERQVVDACEDDTDLAILVAHVGHAAPASRDRTTPRAGEQVRRSVDVRAAQRVPPQGGERSRGGATATDENAAQPA